MVVRWVGVGIRGCSSITLAAVSMTAFGAFAAIAIRALSRVAVAVALFTFVAFVFVTSGPTAFVSFCFLKIFAGSWGC
jgi:hypothetical protein